MGLNGIVVRELVKRPEDSDTILGSAFVLKYIGLFIGFLALLIYLFIIEFDNKVVFYYIAASSVVLLIRPFFVLEFWFHSQVAAKNISISSVISNIVSSGLKIAFVFASFSIIWISLATILQVVIALFFLVLFYHLKFKKRLIDLSPNKKEIKELFSQGWLVFLGSIFAVIYLKIDTIMIKWFQGTAEVGLYSVAAQLSEAWYFIPTAIVASLYPKLIKNYDENPNTFNNNLKKIFTILFYVAFIVAVLVSFFGGWAIVLLFGEDYAQSASILTIHIWASLFIFMRAAVSKWILIKGYLVFSVITQGLGALTNVVLNLILIPKYGGQGAAIATLLSYSFSSFFCLCLFTKTRGLFFMMTRSILLPLTKNK